MRPGTLCILKKPGEILLAMKKRGFGAGKWNGLGGKILSGETPDQAAIRELEEEADVTGKTVNLEKAALLKFRSANPEYNWDVHVFFLSIWAGTIAETEEMRPQWFALDDIPYDSMWIDDRHWLPEVLDGRKIEAEFIFNEDASKLQSFSIKDIEFP
jgi:8-oxo-dGTP pyrophosphatase MutT (NUDIX family)